MTDDARWFVGVDWASQAHQACLIDAGGKIISEQVFAYGGAGLAELCTWLLAKTAAAPTAIAVAIEVPHGPIVETLLEAPSPRMPARLPPRERGLDHLWGVRTRAPHREPSLAGIN